jgi:hypothetical protein
VTTGNEDLGYLPGKLDNKVGPYAQPALEAIGRLTGDRTFVAKLREANALVLDALAYLRGCSLSRAFVVADEMQNATAAQIECLLTRPERDAKMAILGDPNQSDLHTGTHSGTHTATATPAEAPSGCALRRWVDAVKADGYEGARCVEMAVPDVQRGATVQRMLAIAERVRAA